MTESVDESVSRSAEPVWVRNSSSKGSIVPKCRKCGVKSSKSEWSLGNVDTLVAGLVAAGRIATVGVVALILNSHLSQYKNLAGRKSRKGGVSPCCGAIHVRCPDCEALHYVTASSMGSRMKCRKCDTKFYFVPTGS